MVSRLLGVRYHTELIAMKEVVYDRITIFLDRECLLQNIHNDEAKIL